MENFVKKFGIWILIVGIFVSGGYFLYRRYSQPLPGQGVPDQGREHIPDTQIFDYNSNPPTSGKHYEEWVKKGVYDKPTTDGHLVHSLEHGYVIMSYNCLVPSAYYLAPPIFAHEEDLNATSSGQSSSPSAELSGDAWKSEECKYLVERLTAIYEKKGKTKLVIIPRPNLDTRIALTAWTRIDKFQDFDEARIIKFIDAYRDRGPEKTMEQ